MKTFSNTISVPNGLVVLHVDGRHLRILDDHEQKCKLSLRACERRCNQFEEHLLNGCTGDTPSVTYNMGNSTKSMWNLWWTDTDDSDYLGFPSQNHSAGTPCSFITNRGVARGEGKGASFAAARAAEFKVPQQESKINTLNLIKKKKKIF
jgi:hypothetical protein